MGGRGRTGTATDDQDNGPAPLRFAGALVLLAPTSPKSPTNRLPARPLAGPSGTWIGALVNALPLPTICGVASGGGQAPSHQASPRPVQDQPESFVLGDRRTTTRTAFDPVVILRPNTPPLSQPHSIANAKPKHTRSPLILPFCASLSRAPSSPLACSMPHRALWRSGLRAYWIIWETPLLTPIGPAHLHGH
ncbi:hypothetical protein AOQ84DRAFT_225877 [Glonium stellatum]|uniref:Uncharacterized protein n=1 Tax=Glonium stellatum TaxID=574774 RepID=A0A8E2ETC1_9PEZI|nr:hypothetical protein AOQ84DRAFT_225877 [Glonium stellatum]